MFKIFGCPMHYGVGNKGLIDSVDYLNQFCDNQDFMIIDEVTKEEKESKNLKNLNSVIATCNAIAKASFDILKEGHKPLYIGGDHSAAMGSVSAVSSYYDNEDVGLIWVDAHPDINTDKTTETGNIHGMPVAALLGMGEPQLVNIFKEGQKIKPENVVMIGLRDIDAPEAIHLKEKNILYFTFEHIQKVGIDACLKEAIQHLSHLKHVHISFDIDVMDPQNLPGVSVPVPSGFQYNEIFSTVQTLLDSLPVSSFDIVEFNKIYDKDNITASFAKELIELVQKSENK